ncbi:SRPBCC family protein [Streptomyces sp. G45]|uniref:SRPBCC family protein n=1 Tax=Streptomyces sp. G45 TaxID=3406627 RepID=UPI003C250CCA
MHQENARDHGADGNHWPHGYRPDRYDISFAAVWRVPLPADAAYATLADVAAYPSWWTPFRAVRTVGPGACDVVIRSVLPYALRARLTAVVEDPAERVLEAALDGDVSGSVRWVVLPDGSGACAARFAQHVTVRKAALRRWMPFARPFFHLNHGLAMRAGRRGLAARARRGR